MPAPARQPSPTARPDPPSDPHPPGTAGNAADPADARAADDELAFARGVLAAETTAINTTAALLDGAFLEAVSRIVACAEAGGTVLVTGLGKSGLVGAKVSATLASLGIPSHPVHPAEAAHGDLGRFRATDTVICLSRSGETDEVVNLAAILRQDGLPIISITAGTPTSTAGTPTSERGTPTSNGGTPASKNETPASKDRPGRAPSSLERLATVCLHLGEFDEAGQRNAAASPAPTASTAATLALGDALALTAARRRRFTDADFARRHPGGALGGLLRPVTSILRVRTGHNCPTVGEHTPVLQAIAAGDGRRAGAVLVVADDGTLAGIFTDADLRRKLAATGGPAAATGGPGVATGGPGVAAGRSAADTGPGDWMHEPIGSVMTRDPVSLPDSALVRDAVTLTRERRLDEIPVVDARGRPIGVLDVQDLIAMRLVRDETAAHPPQPGRGTITTP